MVFSLTKNLVRISTDCVCVCVFVCIVCVCVVCVCVRVCVKKRYLNVYDICNEDDDDDVNKSN